MVILYLVLDGDEEHVEGRSCIRNGQKVSGNSGEDAFISSAFVTAATALERKVRITNYVVRFDFSLVVHESFTFFPPWPW